MVVKRKKKEILVLGGGPAGMMAAIAAARHGAKVTLLERMPEPGLKLCASGGGRSNITNTLANEPFMDKLGRQGRFAEPALSLMGSIQLREFLASINIPTHTPNGFHVYPICENATQVRDALRLPRDRLVPRDLRRTKRGPQAAELGRCRRGGARRLGQEAAGARQRAAEGPALHGRRCRKQPCDQLRAPEF